MSLMYSIPDSSRPRAARASGSVCGTPIARA
jgi:hypothetical protein